MTESLPFGSVIGILGGGQLGRMLAVAASRLGYRCHIYAPGGGPAADVSARVHDARYDDAAALKAFARSVDVVTFEFENIPVGALDVLAPLVPVYPGRRALEISQDRLPEKQFLQSVGLQTAPFADITDRASLEAALGVLGTPALLKTRRLGYDGKGQVRIDDAGSDAAAALSALDGAPAILEAHVPFTRELSVIAARNRVGDVAAFDPGANVHDAGILRRTVVPAPGLSPSLRTDAVLIAARILSALDYVGVLGVELFETRTGFIVNEIAPRVHNSGHWTQNGCAVDQFEQHIRAITGLPLGDGARHSDVTMENLIGADLDRLPELLTRKGAAVHLYGKPEIRAGRKMGHVNHVSPLRQK